MNTKAVRLYGKKDLRLEEFTLPKIKHDEILVRIVSDSICMSSFKAAEQGTLHKRVPDDVADNPVIIGHEFCGEIVEVGVKWRHKWTPGQLFSIQPAINYKGSLAAPGYSYPHLGGSMTYGIVPNEFMELECLLPFGGDAFFYGSLAEPMSCIVGGFHANYHTTPGSYVHKMDIVKGGRTAILAGAGPMGLGAVDYAIHCENRPSVLVVTDIDASRLARAEAIISAEYAEKRGVTLCYVNTSQVDNPVEHLKQLASGGYDDVFVYAPVRSVIEMGDKILGFDGCLNFFAGPTSQDFVAEFNFYNVHYGATHIVGTSGGNTDDMRESLAMMEQGLLNPAAMITHVGGLDSVVETTLNLPSIPGGKKLVYTGISMPMTAIDDFAVLGKSDPIFQALADIATKNNGLWSTEAERYLLKNATPI